MFRVDTIDTIFEFCDKKNIIKCPENATITDNRQQTNQWHLEEEIHKVNICCTYSLEASQYETLQSLIEMFCNIIQKAVMVYIKLKKMKRRKLAPTPDPHPTYTKKDLTLTMPDTKKINVFLNQSK